MNNQNRRNFLKGSATLGASVFASSIFSFASSANKREQDTTYKKDVKHRTLGTGKHSPSHNCLGQLK